MGAVYPLFTVGGWGAAATVSLDLSASAILSTLGVVGMMAGSVAQGNIQKANLDYQARVNEMNATLAAEAAGEDAALIKMQASRAADLKREEQQRRRAVLRANRGASGGGIGDSALALFEGQAYWDEMEIQDILQAGESRASARRRGGSIEAASLTSQAEINRRSGSAYQTAGYFGALSTLTQAGKKAYAGE